MAKAKMSKATKKALRAAENQGYRIKETRKGHAMVFAPNGVDKTLVALHTRDNKKDMARLVKIGVKLGT